MRIVELSNHPEDLLTAEAERREQERAEREARFRQAQTAHAEEAAQLSERRSEARLDRRPFSWLGATLALWQLRSRRPARAAPPPGTTAAALHEREQLAAGVRGEQLLANELAEELGEAWTLFRGYRNRQGEIDHLLLGPPGLIAIEVKYRNATVSCDGDDWTYVKYDRYGNEVDDGDLCDRAGRSPSEQLNEPADALEGFLVSRGQQLEVERVLIFNHPRAELDEISEPTVGVDTDAETVFDLVEEMGGDLSTVRRARIDKLIVRDRPSADSLALAGGMAPWLNDIALCPRQTRVR